MKRRRVHALRRATCVLVWCLSCSSSVSADDGPIILGQTQTIPTFHLDRPEAKLSLESLYTRSVLSDPAQESHSQEFRFDEIFSLSTTGYVVHPSVFQMDLEGAFGLTQSNFSGDGASATENGTLYAYDTSATFFKPRPLSGTVYARRNRTLVDRTFGPSLENTQDTFGAYADLHLGRLNSHLEVFRSQTQLLSLGDDTGNFDYTENTLLWNNRFQISDRQELTGDYTLTRADQNAQDFSAETQRQDARLQHVFHFGHDKAQSLTSTFRFLDQTGSSTLRNIRWEEYLRLRHSDTLESTYRYLLDNRESHGNEQTRHRLTAGFRHHLYDSLITSGQIGVQKTDPSDGSGSNEYFGHLDFDYRKQVPYGTFVAGLGLGFNRQENSGGASPISVIDESRLLGSELGAIVLTGPNIRTDTIVLTDPTGLRIYQLGEDYTVEEFSDRVEIRPRLGGPLSAGDTVLLDYGFAGQPANTTTTHTFSLNARYDIEQGPLRGLSPYMRYIQQDQSTDSDDPGAFISNSFRDTLIGLEYRIADFTFTGEKQWRSGEILPFEATRFTGKWDTLIAADTTFLLAGSYTIIDYTQTENHVELWTASAQVQRRLANDFMLTASVLYRDESDESRGHTVGFEQQVEVKWKHRQLEVFLRARNSMLDGDDRDNNFQFVQFGIQREF